MTIWRLSIINRPEFLYYAQGEGFEGFTNEQAQMEFRKAAKKAQCMVSYRRALERKGIRNFFIEESPFWCGGSIECGGFERYRK